MSLIRTSKTRGGIEMVILVAVVGASIFLSAGFLKGAFRSWMRAQQSESAGDSAARKLEALMNSPNSSADLAVGTHSDGVEPISWKVSAVTGKPRLLKIEVFVNMQHSASRAVSSERMGITGYRYHDF